MAKANRGGLAGFTRVTSARGASRPSGFIFQDSAGDDYYLWFDTTGDLRTAPAATAEAAGFDWNADGTVVGAQS